MTELLIVGGLTVDRFADGTSAPGGSVLHSGIAAAAEGAELTFLTVAGPEAEAVSGLDRLRQLGTVVHQPVPATTTYVHTEEDGRRVLVYEAATAPIDPQQVDGLAGSDVVLVAPIADELPAPGLDELIDALHPPLAVFLIQGWLRRLELGERVHPLAPGEVPKELWDAFGRADAIVLSAEDLADAPEDPFVQSAAIRALVGAGPLIVLTFGAEGYLLDDPAADRVVASVPRRVVEGVPMVGAGDTFGAALALHLGRGVAPAAAAEAATDAVIRVLEARRA